MIMSLLNPCRLWARHTSLLVFRVLSKKGSTVSATSSTASKSVTTGVKDLLIYRNDSPKFYHLVSIFSVSQCLFWCIISYNALSITEDPKAKELDSSEKSFWINVKLGDSTTKNFLGFVFAAVGYLVLAGGYMYITRSVKYIVLRKDRKTLSLVTYYPLGKMRVKDVPVECVSASSSRAAKQSYIPLKVKNVSMYYLIDPKGTFPRPELFDTTVGVQRNLNK